MDLARRNMFLSNLVITVQKACSIERGIFFLCKNFQPIFQF